MSGCEVNLTVLTDEELRWFERILMKAQVPASKISDAPR
jgi:hypothetical protein